MRSVRPGSIDPKDSDSKGSKVKKKKRSFEYWVAWLLFLALFFIFLTIFGQNGLLQIGDLKKARMILTKETFALREENDSLRREIKGLKEDPFFIEKVAREELDLVRPNEVVYQFVSSSEDSEKGK
jgi:cell division protein FtsB